MSRSASKVRLRRLFWLGPLTILASLVFAITARFAKDPIRTYQIIAFAFLLLSFLPDIGFARSSMPGASWPNAFALMFMHVVAWAISVTMLARLSTMNLMNGGS